MRYESIKKSTNKFNATDNRQITEIIKQCNSMNKEVRQDFRKFNEYEKLIDSLEETFNRAEENRMKR